MRRTEQGRALGLVNDTPHRDAFNRKRDAVSRETERLKSTWVNPRFSPQIGRMPCSVPPLSVNTTCLICYADRAQPSVRSMVCVLNCLCRTSWAYGNAMVRWTKQLASKSRLPPKYAGYIRAPAGRSGAARGQ